MAMSDQEKLLKFITEVSFAMDDCVLFLDTHPENREAMEYYQNYRRLRRQAVDEYTKYFGPLSDEDVEFTDYWQWVEGPWPWEGEF